MTAAAPPLRQLAARHDLALGVAVDLSAPASDPVYRAWPASEFDCVTAENALVLPGARVVRG